MWTTNPYVLSSAVEQYQNDLMENARRWHLARGARRERRSARGHGAGSASRHGAGEPAGLSPTATGRSDRGAFLRARTAPRSSTSEVSVDVGTLATCGRRVAEPVR